MRILLFIASLFIITQASSQSLLQKVSKGLDQAQSTKSTLDKFKGLLPKKKAKADTIPAVTAAKPETTKTVISISGIDFATLKTINENVKSCQGVSSSNMKFSPAESTIEVSHTGSTEDLYGMLLALSKDVFTDKNIQTLESGKISLKL